MILPQQIVDLKTTGDLRKRSRERPVPGGGATSALAYLIETPNPAHHQDAPGRPLTDSPATSVNSPLQPELRSPRAPRSPAIPGLIANQPPAVPRSTRT